MAYTAEEIADIRAAYDTDTDIPPAVKSAIAGLPDDVVMAIFNVKDSKRVSEGHRVRSMMGRRFKEAVNALVALDQGIAEGNKYASQHIEKDRVYFSNAQRNWLRGVTWQIYSNAIVPEGSDWQEPPFPDPNAPVEPDEPEGEV